MNTVMFKRTSKTDPLRIDEIASPGCAGAIGITFCPGKTDDAIGWARDLDADLDAIRDWGADVVVTLVETFELTLLKVEELPNGITARGMEWHHMPIRDLSIPNEAFELRWKTWAQSCASGSAVEIALSYTVGEGSDAPARLPHGCSSNWG